MRWYHYWSILAGAIEIFLALFLVFHAGAILSIVPLYLGALYLGDYLVESRANNELE